MTMRCVIMVTFIREMQRVMAAEAEATRDARAKVSSFFLLSPVKCHFKPVNCHMSLIPFKVIHSEGERKAARALTEAALLMDQNAACLSLRYLQVDQT